MIVPIVHISGMIMPIVHISGMIIPIVHISGMIIPIVYISGMIPLSIILLNSFKYNGMHKLIVDLIYSLMTQSYPGALPFFKF
jgi:hypothetical protein